MKNKAAKALVFIILAVIASAAVSYAKSREAYSAGADITIDCNVLKKYTTFSMGTFSGTLTLTRGSWTNNATAELRITNRTPGLLHTLCHSCGCPCGTAGCVCGRTCWDYFVSENSPYEIKCSDPGDNQYTDVINVSSSTLNSEPIIHTSVKRADFGDKPVERVYHANGDVTQTGTVTAEWQKQFTRTYRYWVPPVDEDDYGYYVYHNTSLSQANRTVNKQVLCRIYNGKPNSALSLPTFENKIDNNAPDQFSKHLWWTSTPYDLFATRLMYIDTGGSLSGKTEVDGQYTRQFTEQNDAELTWAVVSGHSLEDEYKADRAAAKNRNYNITNAEKAAFASDVSVQSKDYPFRSGYFFNPAGTYTFTITTNIYKDNNTVPTQEHKDLVDAVIKSFRYESNMIYVDADKKAVTIDGEEAAKTGTVYKAKKAYITTDHHPLRGTEVEVVIDPPLTDPAVSERLDATVVERLKHTIPSQAEDLSGGISDDITDARFKAVLEGYAETNSANSRGTYKYTEYLGPDNDIYKITETTKVTITINKDNNKLYTHPQMANGSYTMRAYIDPIALDALASEQLLGLNGTLSGITYLDGSLDISVVGSIYDDAR